MEAKTAIGEPRLLISRTALMRNVRLLRRSVAPNVKICAVVKADAYGHGANIVVDTLCNFSADECESPAVDYLAVASIEEAAQLPETLLPILVLRPVENAFLGKNRESLELAIRNGWMLMISSPAAVDDIARIAMRCERRALVHVMVDTGMTRTGTAPELLFELLTRIESRNQLRLVAIGTHFANGEVANDAMTREQFTRFRESTDGFVAAAPRKIVRHIANSGGTFFARDSHLDMIRPGLGIYGIDPTCRPSAERPLRPAMRWTAPLVAIHDVRAGTSAGYGQTWKSPHDTRVGVVPVGYADGYLRALSNRAAMLIGKHVVPVVGRVSMDFTCIDLHDARAAQLGDEVTVLDNDPLSPASAYELARLADTIPYELFTRIGPRVKRVAVEPEELPVAQTLISDE